MTVCPVSELPSNFLHRNEWKHFLTKMQGYLGSCESNNNTQMPKPNEALVNRMPVIKLYEKLSYG